MPPVVVVSLFNYLVFQTIKNHLDLISPIWAILQPTVTLTMMVIMTPDSTLEQEEDAV